MPLGCSSSACKRRTRSTLSTKREQSEAVFAATAVVRFRESTKPLASVQDSLQCRVAVARSARVPTAQPIRGCASNSRHQRICYWSIPAIVPLNDGVVKSTYPAAFALVLATPRASGTNCCPLGGTRNDPKKGEGRALNASVALNA